MRDVVEPPAPGAAAALPLSAAQNVQQAILRWYAGHARDLPWRRPDASPWSVLVSEFMLQQTPVARVLPAHEAWLRRWPTPAALAASSPGDAIRQWGRLGYPRRAVRLHACARIIAAEHDGQVPDRLDALLALPGVGQYTAAAVASFAFGQRHPVLDTNVRRVLARLLAGRAFPSRARSVAAASRAAAGSALVGRGDGARRPGLHGGAARLRSVPGGPALLVARRRTSPRHAGRSEGGRRRPAAAAAGAAL